MGAEGIEPYLNVKFICNSILLYNLPNTIIGKKQLSYFDNFDKIIINHPSQLDSSEFTNSCIPKIRLIPDYINKPIKLNNSLNIRNTLKIDKSRNHENMKSCKNREQ